VRSGPGKTAKNQKKKEKKSTVVSSQKKSTVMSPIRRRMKKRNPSSGQNGQLVHWWLLIHSGPHLPSWDCDPSLSSRLLTLTDKGYIISVLIYTGGVRISLCVYVQMLWLMELLDLDLVVRLVFLSYLESTNS